MRWFDIDPCYVFHTLNAYEEGGDVVVDVVRHDRMFATDFTGPNEGPASLTRFTLDLAAGKAREDRFEQHAQEFPRHDERRTGRRHRYGYAVGFDRRGPGRHGAQARRRGRHHRDPPARRRQGGQRVLLRAALRDRAPRTTAC